MAGLFLLGASNSLQNAVAEGDTRTLSFHHLHTGEIITITYKRDGRYDADALKKLDWFMRDWRKQKETHMDPHLFDLLWEVYREVGGTQPIQVVCGYRSPETNAMLRARSSGVAQFSQHTQGHAMDFYIPGVPLEKVREIGLQLQRGGVGFYPTSGSPFVHMDTGTIRHWPRMTYAQLSKVFPNGRTVHVPSNGHPLPGYALALAEVERRGGVPNGNSLEAARTAGVISASQERQAASVARQPAQQRSLLARLFDINKSKDAEDDAADETASVPAQKSARMTSAVASNVPKPVMTERVLPERGVPLPTSRPKTVAVAAATPATIQQRFMTASVPNNLFDTRGMWHSPGVTGAEATAPAAPNALLAAAGDPPFTGSTRADALSYAADSEAAPPRERARPMGASVPKPPREASMMPDGPGSSVVAKAPLAPAMAIGGQRTDSPWLRAAMLTPSVSGFMTATRFGYIDPRGLQDLLHKPGQSVMMSFSADPSLGLTADRFSGDAVVFVATATFNSARTASLQY
jgi:uncharacterized protein YcbK (DUF882 family)